MKNLSIKRRHYEQSIILVTMLSLSIFTHFKMLALHYMRIVCVIIIMMDDIWKHSPFQPINFIQLLIVDHLQCHPLYLRLWSLTLGQPISLWPPIPAQTCATSLFVMNQILCARKMNSGLPVQQGSVNVSQMLE